MAHTFGGSPDKILILGGVHGDEWEGVFAAKALVGKFLESFTYKFEATIIPAFNADGVLRNRRKNARGVDLNRNLPTNDWTAEVKEERYFPGPEANSEPENKALVTWLAQNKPKLILSLHSWNPLLNTNGRCQEFAQTIAKHTGYEIKESIGYPTPGCLGTYGGLEHDMPTLTYELKRNIAAQSIIDTHVPAILEALKVIEN